ncbi:hypothetical protein Pmani_018120 [Petrolisthes manimaculis]|uniref:Reverse transcriptase domain-containing protein n=1 Tax=Petrolisthes manimaculis TaxID=1843537 RepID=A0AAE1PM15_9EUCA|nr:hypothetical protein Pmani_018120 [Petrolisthes manimaculis]
MGCNVVLLDLRKAYLQIRVHRSLWPYQTVLFKGQRYCLTRLGFGLNIAPMVMKVVVSEVLKQNDVIEGAASPYVDDILVNEDVVTSDVVISHLRQFGLQCNPAQRVMEGARVLGLRVGGAGVLQWQRDNNVKEAPMTLTRRSVFSWCGQLVSHLPVCGWLRPAASFIKRKVTSLTRHVRDLRPRMSLEDERELTEEKQGETEEWLIGLRNPAEPAQCGDDATEREMPRRSEDL